MPVTDYKDEQLGIKAHHGGAIQVEGQWYCPDMPQTLVDASLEFRANPIGVGAYLLRIEARRRFQAIRKSRPDKDGTSRWEHPHGPGDPVCDGDRPNAPKFCTQKSISVPIEAGLKLTQEFAYMSAEWRAAYPVRNTVESANAGLKRGTTHNLGDPETRRLRGRASQFLLASLVVVSLNIKKIRDFDKKTNNGQVSVPVTPRPKVSFGHSTMNDSEREANLKANRRE